MVASAWQDEARDLSFSDVLVRTWVEGKLSTPRSSCSHGADEDGDWSVPAE